MPSRTWTVNGITWTETKPEAELKAQVHGISLRAHKNRGFWTLTLNNTPSGYWFRTAKEAVDALPPSEGHIGEFLDMITYEEDLESAGFTRHEEALASERSHTNHAIEPF